MAGRNANEVRVAGDGDIWIAPDGTSDPTTLAALTSPWKNLGYTTEDGVTETIGRGTNNLMVWQKFDPIRVITTDQTKQLAFTLRQTNPDTLAAALGGGVFTAGDIADASPPGKYVFPDPHDIAVVAMVIDAKDGLYTYRHVFHRMQISGDVTRQLSRGDSMNLACTFIAIASDVNPFLLTDDPAFLA